MSLSIPYLLIDLYESFIYVSMSTSIVGVYYLYQFSCQMFCLLLFYLFFLLLSQTQIHIFMQVCGKCKRKSLHEKKPYGWAIFLNIDDFSKTELTNRNYFYISTSLALEPTLYFRFFSKTVFKAKYIIYLLSWTWKNLPVLMLWGLSYKILLHFPFGQKRKSSILQLFQLVTDF